jgi:hypothetical protein
MTTPLLLTVGLIPSMFLLLVVLTTFLNSTRAYAGISLVPLALGLTVFALVSLSAVEHSPDYWWPDLYEKDRLGKRGSDWFGDRADYSGALSTAASGSLSCGYSLNSFAPCDRAGKKSSIQNRNGYHSTLVLKQFA